ncbi:hypothetical protein [Modestobacter sp. SYSU DS0290]
MADRGKRSGGAAGGPAVELGWFAAVFAVTYVVQEAVYRATGWPRLWIILVVLSLGWLVKGAAQRWWARRSADRSAAR